MSFGSIRENTMKVFALRESYLVQTGHYITQSYYYQGFAAKINSLSKICGFGQF
jgi:hypothetical protein